MARAGVSRRGEMHSFEFCRSRRHAPSWRTHSRAGGDDLHTRRPADVEESARVRWTTRPRASTRERRPSSPKRRYLKAPSDRGAAALPRAAEFRAATALQEGRLGSLHRRRARQRARRRLRGPLRAAATPIRSCFAASRRVSAVDVVIAEPPRWRSSCGASSPRRHSASRFGLAERRRARRRRRRAPRPASRRCFSSSRWSARARGSTEIDRVVSSPCHDRSAARVHRDGWGGDARRSGVRALRRSSRCDWFSVAAVDAALRRRRPS